MFIVSDCAVVNSLVPVQVLFMYFCFWLAWVFLAVHRLSLVVMSGSYSSCGAWASHCGGFSCCRAWVPGCMDFSSWNTWALLPHDMWNLPRQDIELVDS